LEDDCFGLTAAVSRIAAILPNDLAPTNMNGPKLTFDQVAANFGEVAECTRRSRQERLFPARSVVDSVASSVELIVSKDFESTTARLV